MKWFKVVLIMLIMIIGGVLILNRLPSKMRDKYQKDQEDYFFNHRQTEQGKFNLDELAEFPQPIIEYLQKMGYLGQTKMNGIRLFFKGADFYLDRDKPKMTIDYDVTESCLASKRIAYIESQLYFLKFNGYDVFLDHEASMQGELLNRFKLFKQEGDHLRHGEMLTYLSEVFLMPNALFNDAINFKTLDRKRVLATISHNNEQLEGVFEFNEAGEMVRFTTDQRPNVDAKGNVTYRTWIAECQDYQVNEQGIKVPKRFIASWLIDGEKFKYFDGEISAIEYY
ncbi:DUF6544 family protein [Facklamia lactis]|uniref:DUF6544 family protein n=1 Tax=Facklamia lactis TaxID=2749967 RepID=UPI0018CD5342|nr:DUF6544 family protein [Facklamia lactis]MBG9980390.1 hypothetical protein [Facklamia lactis]